MNYSYQFTKISPKQLFAQILYKAEGRDPVIRNVNPTDFSEESLKRIAEDNAIRVIRHWISQDAAPDEVTMVTGEEFSAYFVEPKEKIATDAPDYESLTHYIVEGEEERDGETYQTWTVLEHDDETKTRNLLAHVKEIRKQSEMAGTTWVDASGESYLVDANPLSQGRYTSAVTAISSGLREDGGKWKFAQWVGIGEPVTQVTLEDGSVETHDEPIYLKMRIEDVFRPTTNAEIVEIAGVVLRHVQACFDAESVVAEKIKAGNLDIDCHLEFQQVLQEIFAPQPE